VAKKLGVRFVGINIYRIGHFASEYDCHFKAEQLGLIPRYRKVIFPPFPQNYANKSLARYLKPWAPVVTSESLYRFLEPVAKDPELFINTYDYMCALKETSFYFSQVLPGWGMRKPLVKMSKKDLRRGKALLKEMGVPEGAWFVAIHCRTEDFAPTEDQEYRNCKIETLNLAIDEIIKRGGWCIRMGDPRMPKVTERAGLIDYAHSKFRCEFLDIYLSVNCRFFLGSCSGLASVPVLFGTPTLSINMSPMSHVLAYSWKDINLPKLLRSEVDGRILSFPEVFECEISNFRYGHQYRDARVAVIDNTPEEIRDGVIEMIGRIDGDWKETSLDQGLHLEFQALFRDGNYTWKGDGRVGALFLRKHKALFKRPTQTRRQAKELTMSMGH
jgi:putative glycosyltransferase (TIGR04372 family)